MPAARRTRRACRVVVVAARRAPRAPRSHPHEEGARQTSSGGRGRQRRVGGDASGERSNATGSFTRCASLGRPSYPERHLQFVRIIAHTGPLMTGTAEGRACGVASRPLDHRAMHPSYVALPHQLTMHGWMVFHRTRCQPVASRLTPSQARTLAEALNLAATGEAPRTARILTE